MPQDVSYELWRIYIFSDFVCNPCEMLSIVAFLIMISLPACAPFGRLFISLAVSLGGVVSLVDNKILSLVVMATSEIAF